MQKLLIKCESKIQYEQLSVLQDAGFILPLKDHAYAPSDWTVADIEGIVKNTKQEIYVMMDVFYHEKDLKEVEGILKRWKDLSIKGIYFSDPGLFQMAKTFEMEKMMIYHPHTLMTNVNDASFWLDQGIQAIAISALLSEKEILAMQRVAPNAQLLIHGHSLMSISRRPLLTSYTKHKGIDSLRGEKNLIIVEEHRDGKMPIYENPYGTLVYSDDICMSFAEINDFIEAGYQTFILDQTFLDTDLIKDAYESYQAIMNGEDAQNIEQAYVSKYASYPLSKGYYEQETIQ